MYIHIHGSNAKAQFNVNRLPTLKHVYLSCLKIYNVYSSVHSFQKWRKDGGKKFKISTFVGRPVQPWLTIKTKKNVSQRLIVLRLCTSRLCTCIRTRDRLSIPCFVQKTRKEGTIDVNVTVTLYVFGASARHVSGFCFLGFLFVFFLGFWGLCLVLFCCGVFVFLLLCFCLFLWLFYIFAALASGILFINFAQPAFLNKYSCCRIGCDDEHVCYVPINF